MSTLLTRCAALALAACSRPTPAALDASAAPAAAAPAPAPCVPAVLLARRGTPRLDGSLDEPVWHQAAATEPFVHDGARRVVPHTEARAAWDAEALYVALYAADADLRSSDRLEVAFERGGTIELSPDGIARCRFPGFEDCAAAGVGVKLDRDGDVDATAEEDEEWAVEVSVPWSLVSARRPPEQLPIAFSRVETLGGERLREVWGRGCGAVRLDGLR